MGGLRLRYPIHGPDRVLVVVGHVTHVFHDADDFILGRILDLVRPEMLAERVLVFEESQGEGFIDHGYGAGGGRVILRKGTAHGHLRADGFEEARHRARPAGAGVLLGWGLGSAGDANAVVPAITRHRRA